MKICEFTEWHMRQCAENHARKRGSDASLQYFVPTPAESALLILITCMEEINQAGLDGKKLSDLQLIIRREPSEDQSYYEVHAKVTHRLKSEAPRLSN
jgi:hypothetical protein